MKRVSLLLAFTLVLVACTPLEQQARNTAAALQGAISAAQTQYETMCKLDATQPACVTINKAVAGQNALVTATEAYCGLMHVQPAQPNQQCTPVKSAAGALQAAIGNANQFISDLKGVIK